MTERSHTQRIRGKGCPQRGSLWSAASPSPCPCRVTLPRQLVSLRALHCLERGQTAPPLLTACGEGKETVKGAWHRCVHLVPSCWRALGSPPRYWLLHMYSIWDFATVIECSKWQAQCYGLGWLCLTVSLGNWSLGFL